LQERTFSAKADFLFRVPTITSLLAKVLIFVMVEVHNMEATNNARPIHERSNFRTGGIFGGLRLSQICGGKSLSGSSPLPDSASMEAVPVIRRCFGPTTQAVLEIVHDPEGGKDSDVLFAFIQTQESPEETLAKLDCLDREWWIDASMQAHCRMRISVEYA
jgi:hypothetical protein